MFERLLNPPILFWQRLFIVFSVYAGAQIALRLVSIPFPVDDSLLLVIFAAFSLIGLFCASKILDTPFMSYAITQLFFFWVLFDQFLGTTAGISMKSRVIAFGFIFLAGITYLYKNFDFLWKFMAFRFFLAFFVINIIYYFFNASSFNVSAANFNGTGDMSENQDSRMIIFLGSLAVLLTSSVALSLFKDITTKEQLKALITRLAKVFCIACGLMLLMFAAIGKIKGLTFHVSSPIYFMTFLALKYYVDNFAEVSKKFNYLLQFVIVVFFMVPIFGCNKATLIAFLTGLAVFLILNFKEKLKLAFIPLIAVVLIFLTIQTGLGALVIDRLDKAATSISQGGINSYTMRQSNWNLFTNYWGNHLDTTKTLFGFGLGKSREVMYYLSRSQYNAKYFVQSVHNQYLAIFFDYGLMALLFFIPLVSIFWRNIKTAFSQRTPREVKLFSNLCLGVMLFYFIYHTMDGLRATTIITFFSLIMFTEGYRYSYEKSEKKAI